MNSFIETRILKVIKEEIEKNGLKVLKIILFGSRAKGEAKEDSDWDFFIVINQEIDFKMKKEILSSIYKKLIEELNCDFEIVITSLRKFNEAKNVAGTLSYEVEKDGMLVWE